MNFFQGSLEKDFGYGDDLVIESMHSCADELRRARLDLPPPPADDSELPSKTFGVFVPPTIEQIIGRQSLIVVDGEPADNDNLVIPADGGPVIVPMRASVAVNHRPSSVGSSSALDHYDTATDGLSSRRISVRDGHSSVTSLVDEFLDIEDDIGNVTTDADDLQVDNVDVNDDLTDTRQWPWNSSMPYITSAGPTSRMVPAPAMRSQLPLSPMSDTAIEVDRNTIGMVSLNQPVSFVTVVAGEKEPALNKHPSPQRFVPTQGETSDAGVREFFAPSIEPWSRYVRNSPYRATPSAGQHSTNTQYHLHALKSAKDRSRQQYFSSGRVDGKTDMSHRSRINGFAVQTAHHRQQPGAVSAPSIGSGWATSPVSTPNGSNMDMMSRDQPVVNVRSRVTSASGNQVGSKVIFPGRDVSSRPPYMSSVSQPVLQTQANWIYRM